MIDKIKVGAFCHSVSRNPWSSTLFPMPQYIADELGGDCTYFSVNILKAWTVILSHASDIHVLVVDDESSLCHRLCQCYRWLNPAGKVVTFSGIKKLLLSEKQYSDAWTEANYRLWVNRVLLPQIGFEPLAEVWEKCV